LVGSYKDLLSLAAMLQSVVRSQARY